MAAPEVSERHRRVIKTELDGKGLDPAVGNDVSVLEKTQATQVAPDVYARVVAIRGANGPLATKALQRHPDSARFSVSPITAWWSPPDGQLGRPSG